MKDTDTETSIGAFASKVNQTPSQDIFKGSSYQDKVSNADKLDINTRFFLQPCQGKSPPLQSVRPSTSTRLNAAATYEHNDATFYPAGCPVKSWSSSGL